MWTRYLPAQSETQGADAKGLPPDAPTPTCRLGVPT